MRKFVWTIAAMALLATCGPAVGVRAADDAGQAKEAVAAKEKAEAKEKDSADEKAKEEAKAKEEKAKAEAKVKEDKTKAEAADKAKDADSKAKESKVKSKKVRLAHIKIAGDLPESPGEMSLFGDMGVDLRKMMTRLERASEDDAIAGVVLQIDATVGRGKLNELRAAVKRVQAKGKKVYAYLESAMGPQYCLAAACDEVVMPESGQVVLPGVRAEIAFYKDMLSKLGIEADIMHVGDYKGAAETYTRDSLSEPVRKNMTALVDDLYEEMLTTIAADRDLNVEEVRKAVNQGLLSAAEAKKFGLIDRVEYADQFRAELGKEYKTDRLVYVLNYDKKSVDADFSGPMGMMKMFQTIFAGDKDKPESKGDKLAIVYAVGPIMSGESESGGLAGNVMGSTTIVEALRQANKDDHVKAIVMRVDSPGGSALASDLIWRETQAIEKPIIVSMGDVAASGGYYISMGADRIFVEPGTITGSIGVLGGKLAMKGFYDWIGLDVDTIARGNNSGIFSSTDKFSKSEREVIEKWMHETYDQFTTKAAAGRHMKVEDLEKLAGGQVFTGRVAKRNGLVDEVGTLRDAIQSAKRMAGLDPDQKVELKILPEPKNPFEALFGADLDAPKEDDVRLFSPILSVAPELRGPMQRIAQLRKVMREPVTLMMPYWFEIK
jgi:protease-4